MGGINKDGEPVSDILTCAVLMLLCGVFLCVAIMWLSAIFY